MVTLKNLLEVLRKMRLSGEYLKSDEKDDENNTDDMVSEEATGQSFTINGGELPVGPLTYGDSAKKAKKEKRQVKIKADESASETNFRLLQGIKNWYPKEAGFLNADEMNFLTDKLQLKQMNQLELQNLRDTVVMLYQINQKENYGNLKEADRMSALTGIIDYYLH